MFEVQVLPLPLEVPLCLTVVRQPPSCWVFFCGTPLGAVAVAAHPCLQGTASSPSLRMLIGLLTGADWSRRSFWGAGFITAAQPRGQEAEIFSWY